MNGLAIIAGGEWFPAEPPPPTSVSDTRALPQSGSTRPPASWSAPWPASGASARDDLRRPERSVRPHLGGDAVRLLDEGRHDLRLRNGLDDLALDEDLPLAVAARDTEVGLTGLTRSVHDTPHDRDAERDRHVLEPLGHTVGEGIDVDLRPSARRAGDDLQLPLPEVQRLQDLVADLDLLGRRRRERDADRVADTLGQENAERGRRLDRALEGGSRLGHAEVQRPVAPLGQQPVGLDHDDGVVVLDRDLEVVEVMLLEQRCFPHGALHERLRSRLAVFLQQPLVERARVHADAERDAGVGRRLGDLAHLVVELTDVARVHTHRRTAGVDRLEDVLGLEVDVGDDRDLALLRDDVQHVGVVLRGDGDADDLAARGGELGDLLQGPVDVGGLRRRHGLDRDGSISADEHLADPDLPGLATRREDFRDARHPQVHCWHSTSLRRPGWTGPPCDR
ncbi:hypothetical protein ABE10_02255 [Bacillus toyonensis]|nr:hypothetical protein [Bacillus toyonensis]